MFADDERCFLKTSLPSDLPQSKIRYQFKLLSSNCPRFQRIIKFISSPNNQFVCWLYIFNDYVIQQNQNGKTISGFQASLQYKIEIQKSQNGLIQIKFIFFSPENYYILMQSMNLETIEIFIQSLKNQKIYQTNFDHYFSLITKIGSGSSAAVFQSSSKTSSDIVAVRCINREKVKYIRILQQVSIMKSLTHSGTCQLLQIFQSKNQILMVMKLQTRDLLRHLQKFPTILVKECNLMMKRLAQSVSYLHQEGIMHRDLKLQNILIRDDRNYNIQPIIADYGLATRESCSIKICGTHGYMAPEILLRQKPYTKQCDIFSLGIIFFCILFRKLPSYEKKINQLISSKKTCIIDFDQKEFLQTSIQTKSMLSGMLQIDPDSRFTAKQVLDHSFFTEPQLN